MTVATFEIDGRRIGGDAPPWIVAEIGINHGGDPRAAGALLHAAAAAGADAVKLQCFETARFLARGSPYYDLLGAAELSADTVGELMALARQIGITLFAAVFDEGNADLMASLSAPAFKIASGDITHLPLIRHVAGLGKPVIVSTGGATLEEIEAAVEAVVSVTAPPPLALLHCVSSYPTEPADANLACMATMRRQFNVPVGFSDHTLGNASAIAAVALGVEIIEKHFTLDRNAEGPDHALSADPAGLTELVRDAAVAHAAVGSPRKRPVEDAGFIPRIRRSITALVDIGEGQTIAPEMLAMKRPGTGLAPDRIDEVVGRVARRDIAADEPLDWTMLA